MANVTVDIQARVVGYEQSIKSLQAALAKVDPGSDIGKSITKAMEQAQSQVKALSKNMFPKASSDTQIDAIIEKTNRAGEAIQQVASLLQNVQVSDLNLGAFGGDIENFKNQLSSLQTELDSKLNAGIIKAVGESEQLKNVFKELGTDLSKATGATLLEDLSKGAQKASENVAELEKKLEKAQTSINNYQTIDSTLKSSRLGTLEGRTALDDELKTITGNYDAVFEQLRTTMTSGFSKLKTDTKLDTDGLLKTFFSDLTPENVQSHIQNLFNTLSSQGVFGENEKRKFYEAIFGGNNEYNTNNINSLTKSIGLDKAYEQYKAQLQEFYRKIANDIDGKDQAQINRLISADQLDKAVNATTKALDNAYSKIYNSIKQNQERLNSALSDKDNIVLQLNTARQTQDTFSSAEQALRQEIEAVRQENKNLENQIAQLREELNQKLSGEAGNIRNVGTTENHNTGQGLRESLEISEAYKNQLAQVAAKEQALGKLQGVVQRWFSIYAAIRMVRQAINSVISTIKELDKTITEIAIVTSMDQSELWDQMPKYTQLARDYAASISGVYQVSQLYYQQGLQTADVMALTEQTLKMARISGLDYAQATDYMTNAVRSFKMEMTDAQTVVDVYSAIAASSATSVTELASAMSKTASSAEAVGSSFQNTTAMMAVMIEATRESAENIGSAMKSIISRYGEMTSDPSKLVDSEGQEMSLNRVDKALQTVGISIHNAEGEFRNFDEVIMELAEKWNTIDTNTQRYIATIMAGNRQQSRFLALVSSYDRLKELSTEAAESEDASQLQFLKTLDSIEAKTQQLQTSIQALYVNSGLEDFYKKILDLGNRVLTTFDQLAENQGLALAVTKIGASFVSLATLVTNAFNIIKMSFSRTKLQIIAESKVAALERELDAAKLAASESAYAQQSAQNQINSEDSVTANKRAEIEERIRLAKKEAQENSGSILNSKTALKKTGGMVASAAGLALTSIAAQKDVNEERQTKALMTGIGSALSGIGTYGMIGGIPGAIVGTITAIPGIVEAIGMSTESVTDKVNRLNAAVTEASNKTILAQDEVKTLEDYKNKLIDLTSKQYDSAEAKQAYLDLNNEIAGNYPELISYIDEEGNKIIALGSIYDEFYEKKKLAYAEAARDEGRARIAAASDGNTRLTNAGIEAPSRKLDTFSTYLATGVNAAQEALSLGASHITGYGHTDKFSVISKENEAYNYLSDQLASSGFGNILEAAKSNTFGGASGLDIYKALFGSKFNKFFSSFNLEKVSEIFKNNQLEELYQLDSSDSGLTQLGFIIDNLIAADQNYQQASTIISQILGETVTIDKDLYEYRRQASSLPAEGIEKIIKNENRNLFNNFSSLDGVKFSSVFDQEYLAAKFQDSWKTYEEQHAKEYTDAVTGAIDYTAMWDAFSQNAEISIQKLISEYSNTLSNLDLGIQSTLDKYFKSPSDYSLKDWTDLLGKLNLDEETYKFIQSYITDRIVPTITNFNSSFKNLLARYHIDEDLIDYEELSEGINPQFLSGMYEQYEKVFKNSALPSSSKENIITDLNSIYSYIGGLDEELRTPILAKLSTADLTSLSGIHDFISGIEAIEGFKLDGTNLDDSLDKLKQHIKVNIPTEISQMLNSYSDGLQSLSDLLSKASKGMSLKDAIKAVDAFGITLADFNQVGEKFYLKDLTILKDQYIKNNNEYYTELLQQINDQADFYKENQRIGKTDYFDFTKYKDLPTPEERRAYYEEYAAEIQEMVPLLDTFDKFDTTVTNSTDTSLEQLSEGMRSRVLNRQKDFNLNKLLTNKTVDDFTEISNLIDEEYATLLSESGINVESLKNDIKAYLNNANEGETFSEYIRRTLGEQLANVYNASEEAVNYLLASTAISQGNLDSLLDLVFGKEGAEGAIKVDRETIKNQIAIGKTDNLPKELQKYSTLIQDTFKSVRETTVNALISAVGDGSTQIKVTDLNKGILEQLQSKQWIEGEIKTGEYVTIAATALQNNAIEFQNYIAQSFETTSEKIKALAQYHQNQYSNTQATSLDKVLTTEAFSYEDMLQYLVSTYQFNLDTSMKDLPTLMDQLGLAFNSAGEVIVSNYEAWITSLEFGVNTLKASGKASQADLNKAWKKLDDARNAQEQAIASSFDGILKDYSNISTESVENLANALNMSYAKLTGYINEAGEYVEGYLTSNGNGTYQLDTSKLSDLLSKLKGEVSQATAEAIEKSISSIGDTYLSNIKNATSYTTKGASSLADVETFRQSYADIVGKALSDDAFSYNSVLQSFVLDESYMDEYINAQREKLRQLNYSEEFIDQYIKDQTDRAIQDSIALNGLLNATTSTERNDEANKLIQQIRGLSNYKDLFTKDSSLIQKLKDHHFDQESFGRDWEQYQEQYDLLILETLESGGQDAVELLKEIKPNASSDELEAIYNNAINKLRTAQEDLGKGVGETISGLAADIGDVTGALDVVRLDDGTAVITAVHDMVDAYATIYTQMKETAGHTVADLNNAYVQLLTAQDQKSVDLIEALNNASGMTYEAIGQIFTRYGIELEQALLTSEDAGIARVGYNKIAITDFTKFKGYIENAIGDTIEIGTQEYLEAYSAYVDSQINMRSQGKNNLQTAFDQLKSVTEAKVGDLLNITYLEDVFDKSTKTSKDTLAQIAEKFGASIKDGILTISKYTDVPGLLQAVAEEAGRAGLLIPEQLAELTDAIADMLSNITSLISSGITGTLNNTDALSLQNWAEKQGLQPLEFNQTAEGLQLTADSLALVYAEMKRVNSLQAQSLLPTIIESNDRYSTLAGTLQAAAEVTQRIDFTRATITNPSRTVMGDVGVKGVALITPVLPDGTELGDDWAKTLATKYANGEINLNTKLQGSDGRELSYTLADVSRGLYTAENAVQQATSAMQSYNEAAESAAGANKDFTASLDSLTAQSSLMSDIVLNKLTDPDAMNFMSDKLPDNYQVAINAWENASKAIKTLNTASKNGYIGVEDFYNIVNTSAGLLEAAGKEFNIKGMNAAELMEAACQNLKVVDGDLKIDLSSAGLDMVSGVDDLKNNLTDGIHELADAEVAILDAEIQVLEVLAAMESMGDMVVDADNNGISFELNDMFTFDVNGDVTGFTDDMETFLGQMQDAIRTSDDLKAAVKAIQINGTTLYDLFYGTAEEWEKTFGSAEAASKFMQKLSNIDWGTDINTIQTQIVNAMKDLGQNLVIDVGDNGLVGITAKGQLFNIDLDDKDVAAQAQQAVNAFRTEHPDFFEGTNLRDNVKQLINELNNPKSKYSQVELQYTLKVITGEIKIEEEKNDKGQKTDKFVGEYAGVKFRAGNIGDVKHYIKQAIDLENQGLSKIEFNEETGEVSGTLNVGAARIKVTKNGDKTTIETDEINGKRYDGDTVEGAVKWLAQQGYADNSLAGKTWSIKGAFYEVIQDSELGITYTFTRSSAGDSWLYNGQTFYSYDAMAQYIRDIVPLEQGLSNDWYEKAGKQHNEAGQEVKIWTNGTATIEYNLETGKTIIRADNITFKSRAEADQYLAEKAMADQQKDSGGEITDTTGGGKTITYTTASGDTYVVEYNSTGKVKTTVTMANTGYTFVAESDTELAMGLAAAAAIAKQKAGELPELNGNQGTVTIHTGGENYEVILDDTGTVTVKDSNGNVQKAISEEVTKNLNQSKIDTNLKATISTAITEALSALPEAINSIEPSNITSVSEALSGISSALAAVVGDTNWDALIAKLQEVAGAASGINLPTGGNNEPETSTPSNKSKLPSSPSDIDSRQLIASSGGLSSLSSDAKEAILEKKGEAGEGAQQIIDEVNTTLTAGQQTLTTTSTNTGTVVTESFASAMTSSLSTLSEGITKAVESVDKSYTELETRTEQVAGSIRSHWDALVNQITAAVSLIQSLVQSLQEKISITWTIGSEGGTSDSSAFGSGRGVDPTREMTALTEYMDKMLSTMEHNKENDTFTVTMPAITVDTSKTEVNIDDIGTKVQEEATKNPVESLTIPVGAVTVDLAGASINIGENSVSTDENSQVTLESVKGVVGNLGDELDMTLLPQDLGEQSVKEGTKITISNPINAVVGKLNLEFSDTSEITVPDDAEKPEIDVDVKPAEDKITDLQDQIDGIKQGDELPKINVDITEANTNLTTIQTLITDIANAVAALTISIPTDFVTLFTSLTLNNINTTLANIIEKKTIPIKISLDAKNVLSELGKILQKLTEIQEKANISINGGVNGKMPEEGETPKEGETSQENQPTTTTTEVSQQTKVTTPGGTEIEMNAKVTATEVDGSQAPPIEMPAEADSVTANVGIDPVSVPAEAESVDVPSGTTVAIQASIDVGEAGQSLSLTATYTVTTTGDIPADLPGLKATYTGVNGGGYIPGDMTATVTWNGKKGSGYFPSGDGGGGATGNFGLASGTLGRITGPAHARSTLMGELGPELVVSNGRYFVAGQNGAEMVDLDKDAIVFNHLQTEQLLKNGMSKERGRAVTNERNAVAFAKGNIGGGPAMASASAALAALKQIRSMWQSLLNASVKDLAGAGGSGGGGGGGGDKGKGGGDAGRKAFIEDVERWYNLMQEIAKLEKVINHEETLRAKLEGDLHKNGSAYYKSQKESLSAIQKEIKAQEELNISRREYFNQRRKQLNEDNGPFNQLYEFDEQGQLKYKSKTEIKGSKATNGYAFLADLMAQDPNTGKPKYTVEQQYKILKKAGFAKYMKYDSSGNEIKLGGTDSDEGPSEDDYNTYYTSMVQAFWDRVEAQKSEMQTLYDTVADGENQLLEKEQQRNELLEAMYDNQKELENSVLNAIEDMKQREIDALQDERDKLEEATGKYIDGLSEALDKERQMYDTQENQNELDTKKRRLGILQRSGASAEDIYSLQKEITESEKNMYFDAQQAQIDAIQQASDLEIERLDNQIQIMQDTLDFQKEMGLLWYQVYEVMSKSDAEIAQFVMGGNSEFWSKSPLESAQTYENTMFKASQWTDFRTDQAAMATNKKIDEQTEALKEALSWNQKTQTADALNTYSNTMSKQHDKDDFWKNNKERYEGKFTEVFEETGDRTKAATEASKLFETDKSWYDRETAAGGKFIGTEEKDYEAIDDTYHWVLTYKKEVYGGLNTQYQNKGEQLYFESKKKEEHKWENGECKYCHRKKPKKKKSSGGGGGSRNCSDNCAGVCKGQLSGGTGCSKNCANECRGGCKTGCQGTCTNSCKGGPNDKVGGYTPKKKKGSAAGINNYPSLAKGNRTLIGELGPELIVSKGQYRIAGRSGAEFVDLPDDAIVFNHMQTRSLLQNGHTGRGKSVLSDARSIASSDTNQVVEWKNSLLSKKVSHPASFAKAALDKISATWNNLTTNAQTQSTGNIIIENATVNMNVQKIANDYDAKRAGEQALNEMLRIANKTSAANNIRR